MNPRSYAAARRKWRRWIIKISEQVQELVIDDWLFRQSMLTAAAAKQIPAGNLVYQWTIRAYGVSAAVGVRRVLESGKTTYSLGLLLERIANNPQVLTRASFLRAYPKAIRHLGEADFDLLAGEGEAHFPAATARRDLKQLRENARRITRLVNRAIAHRDRKRRRWRNPTYQEIHDMIAQLDEICCKYRLLLLQIGNKSLLPGNIDDFVSHCELVWAQKR